jgi:hypothetical protein
VSVQVFAHALARASKVSILEEHAQASILVSKRSEASFTTQPDQSLHKVFLAASPADESFAAHLKADLEARGVLVETAPSTPDQEEKVWQAIRAAQFIQTTTEEERRRFIDLLVTAVTDPRGPLIVILTLRADFYDRLAQYPELGRLIQKHHQMVFPMEIYDLRAIIEQSAGLPDVQLTFEGTLVGDLLFEAQGQAGALPLLEFTLDQLFQQRKRHELTLEAYQRMGGVKGALAKHAEATYASLPSEQHRSLVRALFLRLIDPGVTEQDTTPRRAALSELSLPDAKQTTIIKEATDAFIAARLLTTNELAGTTTVEVSHEALIREWKRLAEWLAEAREDIHLQQATSQDVAEWIRRGRSMDPSIEVLSWPKCKPGRDATSPARMSSHFSRPVLSNAKNGRRRNRADKLENLPSNVTL